MTTIINSEQQRIAIAEACGLRAVYAGKLNVMVLHERYIRADVQQRVESVNESHFHLIPDYLNDLNAMHDAEKVLTDEQYRKYGKALVLAGIGQNRTDLEAGRATLSATASQRAEAFLRTLNLYTSP